MSKTTQTKTYTESEQFELDLDIQTNFVRISGSAVYTKTVVVEKSQEIELTLPRQLWLNI